MTYDNGEGVVAGTKIERMSQGSVGQESNQENMVNTYPNNVTDEENHGPETERKLNPASYPANNGLLLPAIDGHKNKIQVIDQPIDFADQ